MPTVLETLASIAVCLCSELTPEGQDDHGLCFCGIIAGDQPYDAMGVDGGCSEHDFEDAKCGQAWVRLTSAYPSVSVGAQNLEPNNCGSTLGFEVEIGVVRCFPIEERGGAVSAEEMLEAVTGQTDDMMAMWRAINCCDALEDYVLGAYQPLGPQGGLVGGTWTLGVLI